MTSPRISLTSPGSVVEAVPYLLGVYPTAEDVAVVFVFDRVLLCTARVDREDCIETVPLTREKVVAHLQQEGHLCPEPTMIVVFYGEEPPEEWESIEHAHDKIMVTGDRWRSLICTDVTCCPPEGNPMTTSPIAATLSFAGMNPALSMAQVVIDTEPLEPDTASIELAVSVTHSPERRLALLAEVENLRGNKDELAKYAERLIYMARRSGKVGAILYVTAGMAYWRLGDGMRTRICLEHCEHVAEGESIPGHDALLSLLVQGINGQTQPSMFGAP